MFTARAVTKLRVTAADAAQQRAPSRPACGSALDVIEGAFVGTPRKAGTRQTTTCTAPLRDFRGGLGASDARESQHCQNPGKRYEGNDHDQLHRARIVEAELAQEIALPFDVEADDATLPLVVDRVPLQAQALQPCHFQAGEIGYRFVG